MRHIIYHGTKSFIPNKLQKYNYDETLNMFDIIILSITLLMFFFLFNKCIKIFIGKI
jgi:hypothetical protein